MNYIDVCYSKDGGATWSNWRTIPMGTTGSFAKQTKGFRWGVSRQWVFRFRITDPVKADFLSCSVRLEGYDE